MANGILASSLTEGSFMDYRGKHRGLLGWILSTDHKRIGLITFLRSLHSLWPRDSGVLMKLEMLTPAKR
jgi:cytochrome c oxidase subunit 1